MATTKTLINQVSTKKITNTSFAYSYVSGGGTYLYPAIQASIVLLSGAGTFTGGTTLTGLPVDAITMTVGQPINLTAANNCPIGSFTVDTSATGIAIIVFTFLVEG